MTEVLNAATSSTIKRFSSLVRKAGIVNEKS